MIIIMNRVRNKLLYAFLTFILFLSCGDKDYIHYIGPENDLILNLKDEGVSLRKQSTLDEALQKAPSKGMVLFLSDGENINRLEDHQISLIEEKKLKVYVEYSDIMATQPLQVDTIGIERVVVTDTSFFKNLPYLSLLTVNSNPIIPSTSENQLLSIAKVAGFDKAVFGLEDTHQLPLLYKLTDNILVSTSPLSKYAVGRFMPEKDWKTAWEGILSHLTGTTFEFDTWLSYVHPSYQKEEKLSHIARKKSVEKGIKWFFNGHFLIDESWKKDWVDKYMGDGLMPIGPELPSTLKDGDGSLGVLEGHSSYIYPDGLQKYRYWLRNDVQGESAMAFALSADLLKNEKYSEIATNLIDFSFDYFRRGPRNDPNSPSFGLLGWSATHQWVYYGDDNARSILGMATASALMKETRWNKKVIEAVIANFRTTGKKGFREARLEEEDIQKNGWEYYWNRENINPHPHFESWLWACYLWLYNKTGYEPLYEKAVEGIENTMDAYPSKWKWTNGIQQERARMLLPLAWLVQVKPSAQHVEWLDTMVRDILKNQVESGAIREELGDATLGLFGRPRSNDEYGKHEAPLIFENGDPVADMLYTTNFAFIGLNEAAKATSNPDYRKALLSLSDFLTKVQVESEKFKSVDGAWFRAFNYENWDYWASNADAGWGAWSTLTGWIQSWIVSTQVLIEKDESLWDLIFTLEIEERDFESVVSQMLNVEEN